MLNPLLISGSCVISYIDQGDPDKSVLGVCAGFFDVVIVNDGVAPFGSGSLLHQFFELMTVPRNRRKEPGVAFGFDVNKGSEGTFRLAVLFFRAVIRPENIG